MVKIRLTRGGAKKRPFYHIIVTDVRSARDGRNIERVGFYNPVAQGAEKRIELDLARVDHWVKNGAQPTDKVRNLIKGSGQVPGRCGLILTGHASAWPSWLKQMKISSAASCWAG